MNIDEIKEYLKQATPEEIADLITSLKETKPELSDEILEIFKNKAEQG